jgi:hypothetical protein
MLGIAEERRQVRIEVGSAPEETRMSTSCGKALWSSSGLVFQVLNPIYVNLAQMVIH